MEFVFCLFVSSVYEDCTCLACCVDGCIIMNLCHCSLLRKQLLSGDFPANVKLLQVSKELTFQPLEYKIACLLPYAGKRYIKSCDLG
jgi:hypothetical protein